LSVVAVARRQRRYSRRAGAGSVVDGELCGADSLAGREGAALGYRVVVYPADWELHGKAAGPIRNEEMIRSGADLVIAFAGGRGTADRVARARRAGIPVREGP
jgi:hypothetical protein